MSTDITKQTHGILRPTHPDVENYIFNCLKKHDEPVLLEMEQLAEERSFPIVGRLVGAFIEVLALTQGAKRVFEFGSGFGYSAYWFTRAVGSDGEVICTEGDEKNVKLAESFLSRVDRMKQTQYHTGWAQEIFPTIPGDFDIIYNDANKQGYPGIWTMAKDRIRPGGLYICDNTIWGGKVTKEKLEDDKNPKWTSAIKEHNLLVANDPDFDFFFNPLRDGVLVARKKN